MKRTKNQLTSTPTRTPRMRASWMDVEPRLNTELWSQVHPGRPRARRRKSIASCLRMIMCSRRCSSASERPSPRRGDRVLKRVHTRGLRLDEVVDQPPAVVLDVSGAISAVGRHRATRSSHEPPGVGEVVGGGDPEPVAQGDGRSRRRCPPRACTEGGPVLEAKRSVERQYLLVALELLVLSGHRGVVPPPRAGKPKAGGTLGRCKHARSPCTARSGPGGVGRWSRLRPPRRCAASCATTPATPSEARCR